MTPRRWQLLFWAWICFLGTTAGAAEAAVPPPPLSKDAPDSTRTPLLEELQESDRRFFSEELWQTDPALRDSVVRELDTLGLDRYQDLADSRIPAVEFTVVPATRLIAYNRVEGLVAGLGVEAESRRGIRLDLQAAYATAPRKLRHLETLRLPLLHRWRPLLGELGYADHVVPYGSNRPTANSLRAAIGSADEQDYLRRQGFLGSLTLPWGRDHRIRLEYEAARQSSVTARADFSVLGDRDRLRLAINLPIEEGMDRGVTLEATVGSLIEARQEAVIRHRVSGGDLGGDFTYVRTDLDLAARRYLPGGHEITLDLGAIHTGGTTPLQTLADAGGLSSVRGFPRRIRLGQSAVHARFEIFSAYDFLGFGGVSAVRKLRLQFVSWADAGRVWEGNSEDWITSLGLGVQRYLGPFGSGAHLRLDAAFPTGPDRPGNVVWYLHFSRALF